MRVLIAITLVAGLANAAAARPTDVNGSDLWKFAPGDVIEHYDTTSFRVFFTRAGVNAVPAKDANGDGIPDDVTEVGQLYEDVLVFYTARGFKRPLSDVATVNNGGDGRFDVYLVDFNGSADGRFVRETCDGHLCSGYMVQENDFAGYSYPSTTIGNRVLCSHEFFHAVQAAYNNDQDTVVGEGTAVWSTEQYDSTLADLEGFVGGYLQTNDRSIDRPGIGPVDPFSYGAAIFFQFLGEALGHDLTRKLYEDCAPGAQGIAEPKWLPALVALLSRDYGMAFPDVFTEFSTWNLFTLTRADPARGYASGTNYPSVKIQPAAMPYEDDALRVFYASAQVLGFDPNGRRQISVEVLPAAGLTADTLAPLRVLVAPVTTGKVGAITTRLATDPSAPVDVTGATQILVELVNTATSGDSTRGILCVGDSNDIAACQAKNAPVTADPATTPKMAGGCQLAARSPSLGWSGGALFLMLVGVARRRMRPRSDARTADVLRSG